VVVAILCILMALLMPALSGAKESARVAVCIANVRSQAMGARLYLADYNGFFPASATGRIPRTDPSRTFSGGSSFTTWLPRFPDQPDPLRASPHAPGGAPLPDRALLPRRSPV